MYQYNTTTRRLARPAGALAAAAALVGALALTPAGSLAASLLTIFEPQQFTAVDVTSSDLQGLRDLPDLSSYGTMGATQNPTARSFASAAEAARASGLTVRTPSALPAGVPSSVTYSVMSQGVASFTFDAAKARAAATKAGETLPAMPVGLDGSTLRLSVGPVVVATYNANALGVTSGSASRDGTAVAGAKGKDGGGTSAIARMRRSVNPRAAARQAGDASEIPSLVVVQAPRPQLTATNNVTVRELEDYLARQPGVSPQLAQQIKSIGDPSATLPIPIPVDRFSAQHVQVQGVDGLAVGDNTGVGSGVIWQRDGTVYAVAGALTQDQVVAVANSLR